MCSAGTPQTSAARSAGHARAAPCTRRSRARARAMKARSSAPSRSSSTASAKPRTTSVPGRIARCRSACSAILMRIGSTTTRRPPLRFAVRIWRTRCRLATVALLPQTMLSLRVRRRLGADAGHRAKGAGPCLAAHAAAQRRAEELASRRACGRSAATCCRRRACRAGPRSSAAAPPAGRSASITAATRSWMMSSASSQAMRSKLPGAARADAPQRMREPAGAVDEFGRCGAPPCCRSRPPCSGSAFEPRTLVMRPSSTVTVRLQVSGQSSVQTLASSVVIGSVLIQNRAGARVSRAL